MSPPTHSPQLPTSPERPSRPVSAAAKHPLIATLVLMAVMATTLTVLSWRVYEPPNSGTTLRSFLSTHPPSVDAVPSSSPSLSKILRMGLLASAPRNSGSATRALIEDTSNPAEVSGPWQHVLDSTDDRAVTPTGRQQRPSASKQSSKVERGQKHEEHGKKHTREPPEAVPRSDAAHKPSSGKRKGRKKGPTKRGGDSKESSSRERQVQMWREAEAEWSQAGAEHDPPAGVEGPWMKSWKNSVGICVIMKEENVTDVREWLMYHRWLGVDRVILYEEFTEAPLMEHPGLADIAKTGFVEYSQANTTNNQKSLYLRCLEEHRNDFNWLAYIDVDEFIALRKRGRGALKEFLDAYKHFAALSVSHIFMGWNSRETRPVRGGVLRHYTQCDPTPGNNVKSIVNTYFTLGGAGGIHNFRYRSNMAAVNEHMQPLPNYCAQDRNKLQVSWAEHPDCLLRAPKSLKPAELRSVDHIALFHYFSKSLQDYQTKMSKGRADTGSVRTMDSFQTWGVDRQQSAPLCRTLAKVADDCCPEWSGEL